MVWLLIYVIYPYGNCNGNLYMEIREPTSMVCDNGNIGQIGSTYVDGSDHVTIQY